MQVCVMPISIEIDREEDGRWIAEIPMIPGCMSYGVTRNEAIRSVEALSLRILADQVEAGDDLIASTAFAVSA
jgi:predicted RNase H-like HicB family nuclease